MRIKYQETTFGPCYSATTINWTDILAQCKKEYRTINKWNQHRSPARNALSALRMVEERIPAAHGVEGFCDSYGNHGVAYINMGDPYDTTIILRGNRFTIGNWGDIVERAPEGRYR